jgi:hypothetical protein
MSVTITKAAKAAIKKTPKATKTPTKAKTRRTKGAIPPVPVVDVDAGSPEALTVDVGDMNAPGGELVDLSKQAAEIDAKQPAQPEPTPEPQPEQVRAMLVTPADAPPTIIVAPTERPAAASRAPAIDWMPGVKHTKEQQLAFLRNVVAPAYGRRLGWDQLAKFRDEEVLAVLRNGLTRGGCFGIAADALKLKTLAAASKGEAA